MKQKNVQTLNVSAVNVKEKTILCVYRMVVSVPVMNKVHYLITDGDMNTDGSEYPACRYHKGVTCTDTELEVTCKRCLKWMSYEWHQPLTPGGSNR